MEQLKKCPFCGNIAYVSVSRKLNAWGYYVACVRCVAKTDYYVTEEASIAAWNTRKPMERILERLKEEMKWHSDKASEELGEFCLEMFHHHTDEALGFEKAIEIVREEM